MKLISRSIKLFFILLTVLLIALLAFVATFDANNYKAQITEQVEQATGRSFRIDGDINLSVFPWVGLKVEQVALGNAPGFSEKPFAAISQLDIKVNVLPLIRKQVEINTIRLHGLELSLEVASDKQNNWSSLTQAKAAPQPETGVTKGDAEQEAVASGGGDTMQPTEKASPLESLQIEGFELVDATVIYDDRSSATQARVTELDLTTGEITFDKAIDISFGARVQSDQPAIDTRLKLTTQLTFDRAFNHITLQQFIFTVLAQANEFIAQDEEISLRAEIDISMDAQRISVKQATLSALGTETLAALEVTAFLQSPLIQGRIDVQAFDAHAVARRAGVELPEMAKPDALGNVALSTKIRQQGDSLKADALRVSLDGSTLDGWVHLPSIAKQQLRYELAFDHLNVDDYLPPVADEAASKTASGTTTASEANEQAPVAESTGDEKIELPLEMMRKLDIAGDFNVAALKVKDYDITQLQTRLQAKRGKITVKPLSLKVLDGRIDSALSMDVQQATPAYAIQLNVNQLQIGPVANPFLEGIMGDEQIALKGAANVDMDVKTGGDTVNQLKKNSDGLVVLDMKQTTVDGFDPEFYMRSSTANYLHEKGFGQSKTIMGSYTPRKVTVFDTIHSSIRLADGKARTDDFLMDSERVQVGAKGFVDIMQNSVDAITSVRLPRGKTVVEKILDSPMYVHVHGPFTSLQYDLDTEQLKKSTTGALEQEARAKVDAEKARLKAKADAEKARLKAKADEEKRRAEEKAKQQLKQNTDKYKDKLKDKLKGLF